MNLVLGENNTLRCLAKLYTKLRFVLPMPNFIQNFVLADIGPALSTSYAVFLYA